MDWFAAYLAFTLLLAGLAWYPCCAGTEPLCIRCTSDTNAVAVTIANVVDGTCDCSPIDTTFVLTRLPDAPCTWRQLGSFACTALGNIGYDVQAGVISGLGGRYYWSTTLKLTWTGFGWAEITWLWDSGDSVPFDCTVTRTLTIDSYDGNPATPTICTDWASMTCQVN